MYFTDILDEESITKLAVKYDTPLFIYGTKKLKEAAEDMLGIPAPFGLKIRYAMKANPHTEILKTFLNEGIGIDASSGFEAQKAIDAGFNPSDILLTSQQIPRNLRLLVEQGIEFNATSLHQLEWYGEMFKGSTKFSEISVRINPGIGSGHSTKTNVGGITSSFGIWHEYIPLVHEIAVKYKLKIKRLHTHIGSGADPEVWRQASKESLKLVEYFPDVNTINLGGGFKVARVNEEKGADMVKVGKALTEEIGSFAELTGRKLKLELEPGTFLVANAGILVARVEDIVDTGPQGYKFIKLNTGMNDILRPGIYGSQHPIEIITKSKDYGDYVVVGHNCESGDLLTPAPGEPEVLLPRRLPVPDLQDIVVISGAGAYCASMATHGYNSYPSADEVII